jgi:hypothetical protein
MLHQGTSQHSNLPYSQILFIEPGYPNYQLHYCVISGRALLIQLESFVDEILRGCELWLKIVENTKLFKTNYARFARRHENSVAPYVLGVPVVG